MNICLSRELGSGGRAIGEQLAKKLGYKFHDREMIEIAGEKSRISLERLEKEDEKKANPWLHRIWYESEDESLRGITMNDILFKVQSRYILECAKKSGNVFVGRCADYVLKKADIPYVSLFITAPFDYRVMQVMQQKHLSEKDAETLVKKTDKERKAYYNYYTDGGWGKPFHYDICINSSRYGIEETADLIAIILEDRRHAVERTML